ncbi:MAG: hypothetical protein Ct9H300mP3_06960 [Gammaproteobacteria bacterium]|nr:MAG: hypothetical protein Ct9H300mP3_06960 [Gammaproteobacteria bacterium]
MKYLTLIFGLFFFSVLSADGILNPKRCSSFFEKYFEARNRKIRTVFGWKQIWYLWHKFRWKFSKPKQISSVKQWRDLAKGE